MLAALALACGSSSSDERGVDPRSVPASLTPQNAQSFQAQVDEAVIPPPAVLVRDTSGRPIAGVKVRFAVTAGGGTVGGAIARTDAKGVAAVAGWVLGPVAGLNELTATISTPDGTLTALFSATGKPRPTFPPDVMAVVAGMDQIAEVGTMLPVPPAVSVRDQYGNPVAGLVVTFAVTGGGGSVTGAQTETDPEGVATLGSWTMGPSEGFNTLTATVPGLPPLPITAAAVPPSKYDVTLRYLTATTSRQRLAFERAVARWRKVLIGDVADVAWKLPADYCRVGEPELDEKIDDLLVYVVLEPIDGPGGILASAGPCAVRSSSGLTGVGVMRFDTDDLANLEADGQLDDVILHELGHVFGLGS
ncbi:MAG TPA: hypothetical protein VE782_08545, partial [Myxococcaceae bacterium]|nr:hypothetical protein [Myxococcaceae bacterium]